MKNYKYLILFLLLPMFFIYTGCEEENPVDNTPVKTEAELLIEYIEGTGGDYLNTANPAIITAQSVRDLQLATPAKLYVMDIRSAADFTGKGHIEGAVNVALKDIATHIKSINATSYEKIVIACYSGQTAGYATAILRLLGYTNVYSLKWGMSSWHRDCANSWLPSIGNNYTNFVTTTTAKAAVGALPTLSTGKTTGKEILEARINLLLSSADPFGDIKVAWNTVTASLSSYYIVNYWAVAHYNLGHLPGAIQYEPKTDLKLSSNLKTLPTNKPVVIYCYTGQTSAQVALILKVLGYDAKTLMFGVNIMNYDWMGTNSLTQFKESEIKDFPFVK